MGEAHDMHGLHGFLEVVLVLLARNRDVTVGQETIVVKSFQQQVRCDRKKRKTFGHMVRIFFFLFSKGKGIMMNNRTKTLFLILYKMVSDLRALVCCY